jgi:hypothetical protein
VFLIKRCKVDEIKETEMRLVREIRDMAGMLIRNLEGNRSLGRPRYRRVHRTKSAPGQTAVIIFERTRINPPSLVLFKRQQKKFCDVYRSGNCIALFARVMRGFRVFNVGSGREIFFLLQTAPRLALGPT